MDDLKEDIIKFEEHEGVGHIIINNPPSNMINEELSLCLNRIIGDISSVALKGVIVYGNGRHFSAGAVLDELENSIIGRGSASENTLKSMQDDGILFHRLSELTVPVVAAIRGVCIGSGFELALSCHYRVCDKNAIMGLVESAFDLMPGCGGTVRLPKIVGPAKALEMILTGARINSEEALRLKIINQVAHHKDLIKIATDYVNRLSPYYRKRYEYSRT